MATNRIGKSNISSLTLISESGADILDSALLRPGRIDRKIEFPPPGPEARVSILRIHSRKVCFIAVPLSCVDINVPRCLFNEGSTSKHWLRKWGNVLEQRFAVFVQKQVRGTRIPCRLSLVCFAPHIGS